MAGIVNSIWNWASSLTSRIAGQVQQDRPSGLPTEKSSNSFWHSEPSEFLLGHRTTAELPDSADIVIIGSGITGTSAARFIAEDERSRDLEVVMLEAREACWGATGRVRGNENIHETQLLIRHTEWRPLPASSLGPIPRSSSI